MLLFFMEAAGQILTASIEDRAQGAVASFGLSWFPYTRTHSLYQGMQPPRTPVLLPSLKLGVVLRLSSGQHE